MPEPYTMASGSGKAPCSTWNAQGFGRLRLREVYVGLLGGLIDKFKQGLKRTQELVLAPMGRLLGLRRLDAAQLEELEDLLLQADLGVRAVDQLMARLRREMKSGNEVDPKAILKEELLKLLHQHPAQPFEPPRTGEVPQVVLLVGVNGVGKTTTLGKLAAFLQARGEDVLVVAGDTFRAAAIDQLERWGERAGVPVIRNHMGGDPAAIAFDGATSARAKGTPWVLIDTAGRMPTKDHLMMSWTRSAAASRRCSRGRPTGCCWCWTPPRARTG